eukprot:1185437-Prorocentrum_minimum.AAC.1
MRRARVYRVIYTPQTCPKLEGSTPLGTGVLTYTYTYTYTYTCRSAKRAGPERRPSKPSPSKPDPLAVAKAIKPVDLVEQSEEYGT